MFVRTQRLSLRPGWVEDAPALTAAFVDERVVMNLARAPWPYVQGDAAWFLSRKAVAGEPDFLIFAHEAGAVRLVGGIGVHRDDGGARELGYWLRPDAWGRGYMTEAGRAVIDTLRDSLRVTRLVSGHFTDNPRSGRVLQRLGFRATGHVVQRHSRARRADVPCAVYELSLGEDDRAAPVRMAA